MSILIIAAYAAAAAYVATHAFHHAVSHRGHQAWLSGGGYAVLALVALVVGAAWPLFVPMALVQWLHAYRHGRPSRTTAWSAITGRKAGAH